MSNLKWSLFAIALLIPSLGQGEETCLWMNAATAGGILGGPVTASVSRPILDSANPRTANAKSSAGPTSADPSGSSYVKSGTDDSDCAFIWHPGPNSIELHIQVRTMNDPKKEFASYLAACGTNATPLKAVGNEAFVCVADSKHGKVVQQLIGRVRDRGFLLRITTHDLSAANMLGDQLRKAADIVSGNLF